MFVDIASIALGMIVGTIYAFSGFRDEGKSDALIDNSRVKNLVYILGGLPLTLLGDFSKVTGGQPLQLTGYYLLAVVVTALIIIVVVTIVLAISARALVSRDSRYAGIEPYELALVYLHSGFRAYRDAKEAAIAKAESKVIPAHEALWNFNSLLIAERHFASNPASGPVVFDQVLAAISTAAQGYLFHIPGAAFVVNYMVAVPRAAATPQQLSLLRFNDPPPNDNCSHLLVVMKYQAGALAPFISLPVRAANDYVLPGAPEAFVRKQPQIMSRKVAFPPKSPIPAAIQTDIGEFFLRAEFESVLSIPLVRGSDCVGIINVESRGKDAFVEMEPVSRLVRALQPHCTLLAYMLERSSA